MSRVLVLRPEPGASATVERARRRGLNAVAVPLFEIECIAWASRDVADFDGLLLTSANALRCGGDDLQSLRALPVYAVGQATAEAALEAGFAIAAIGKAGADELLGSIPSSLRLVHLCGEHRREPTAAPQAITPISVYRARPIASPELGKAEAAVALIHSPRAGRRFAELVEDRSGIAIAAISPVAAEAVGSGWQIVEAAERPEDDELLALVERLCNKLAR